MKHAPKPPPKDSRPKPPPPPPSLDNDRPSRDEVVAIATAVVREELYYDAPFTSDRRRSRLDRLERVVFTASDHGTLADNKVRRLEMDLARLRGAVAALEDFGADEPPPPRRAVVSSVVPVAICVMIAVVAAVASCFYLGTLV